MQNLGFALIDAHIHQWDPYNTPHSARLAVKLLGKHPNLLDKTIRLIKPKTLIETLGRTECIFLHKPTTYSYSFPTTYSCSKSAT